MAGYKKVCEILKYTVADSRLISPLTIRRALEDFEGSADLEPINLGPERLFMAVMTKFAKSHDIVSEQLFGKNVALPNKYICVCEEAFKTQFFKALATYCLANDSAANYINGVLRMALPDAKALAEELKA